jgi:hypothetical protein
VSLYIGVMHRVALIGSLLLAALMTLLAPQCSLGATGALGVTSAADAPWSAHIAMTRPGSEVGGACSGSILDANRVLTAGHCITSEDEVPWPEFEVRAGITSLGEGAPGEEQSREAVRVTSDPFYTTETYIHDVAIVEVEPPFDFSTPYVQPIQIAPRRIEPTSNVGFFGWGDIAPEGFSPEEHRLEVTPIRQWQCPTELQGDPSFSCLRSAVGSSCPGDSGAGVVEGEPPQLLVSVSLGPCTLGGLTSGTDLTSPEIRDWLAGDPNPPRAPEGRSYPQLRGVVRVGTQVRCVAGGWSGTPRLGAAFVEIRRGRILQEGRSSSFKIPRSMLHRKIACVSVASNAGGRTEMRSSNEPLVKGPR